MIRANKNIILLFLFSLLALASTSFAQHVSVPIDLQVKLLPKILSLDKNFDKTQGGKKVRIGIIYDGSLRNSVKTKNEVFKESKENQLKLKNSDIVFVSIDLSNIESLDEVLLNNNLYAVFILPLRGYDISSISKICRSNKIISFTSVPEFISQGVSVSFDIVNEKIKISINLQAAKAEGANFSSHLLKIANVIVNDTF
jgi:hypothetical protein